MFRFVRLSASCRVVGFQFVSFRFVGCGTCNINARHLFPTDLVWHVPSNHSTLHTLLSPLHCTSLYSTHSPHSPQGTRVARYVPRCVGMMGQRRDTLARNLRLVNVPNYMRRQSSLPVDSSPALLDVLSPSLSICHSLSLSTADFVCVRGVNWKLATYWQTPRRFAACSSFLSLLSLSLPLIVNLWMCTITRRSLSQSVSHSDPENRMNTRCNLWRITSGMWLKLWLKWRWQFMRLLCAANDHHPKHTDDHHHHDDHVVPQAE